MGNNTFNTFINYDIYRFVCLSFFVINVFYSFIFNSIILKTKSK